MPTELHLLLAADRFPTTPQWQAVLTSLGLPLTLDPAFTPANPAGRLQATCLARPVTLEFHTAPASTLLARYPGLKGMFPARDLATTVRFGPDPTESAAALAALASLAQFTDAVCFDPLEGECTHPDSLLARAQACLGALPSK